MLKLAAPLTEEEEIVSDEIKDMHKKTSEYLKELLKLKEEYWNFDEWESKEIKPKIKQNAFDKQHTRDRIRNLYDKIHYI